MNITNIENKISIGINNAIEHGWNRLSLRNCCLKEIPKEIFDRCPDLMFLDLGNDPFCDEIYKNKISVIPDNIGKLKKLVRLDISNNKITEISEKLSECKNLKSLNLSNNKIKELPASIANLENLKELVLEGNPFDMLPPEIVARGIDSIRHFFIELEEKDFLYEVKLIIVGEGRVGKTCITKALINDTYILSNEESTEGINIEPWIIPFEVVKKINPMITRDLQINIWDFGGQEIYHSTHQFFLTKRSLYMLVTESRKEDRHDDFFYWLNIIKLLGEDSPVVMVLNKCDQPIKEIPFKEYQESFSNLIQFNKISLVQGFKEGLNEFKKQIITLASNLPHIGNPLPKVWVNVRIEIEELKKKGINFITETEYLEICKRHYRNTESALFLSEYFHDLGVILHFQEDIELRNTVFLNHEWITKGVYKILDDRLVIEQKGRFTNDDIRRIWCEGDYKEKTSELISLMKNRKFDICFELQNRDYLVPRLLPVDEIQYSWPLGMDTLKFEVRYNFMPKGILSRLIVKMHQDIVDSQYWRYGVILQFEGTKALIREKYFENKITIELIGTNRREFLAIIRKTISDIHKDFKKIDFEEMVPCNCETCSFSAIPHFYSFSLLKRYEIKGIEKIRCDFSLLEVTVKLIFNDFSNDGLTLEKVIYCENKNAELLNSLNLKNVAFAPEKDSSGVFTQVRARPEKFGLRDRDFLLDSEITKLKNLYKNYYILDYYCFENYLYHPMNIAQLNINNLSISDYTSYIIAEKNKNRNQIISIFKNSRKSYYELKIDSEKIEDKSNENKIIENLESDDIEIFFKSFSMKDYFDKRIIEKYQIKHKELVSTEWFKLKILGIIDPKS